MITTEPTNGMTIVIFLFVNNNYQNREVCFAKIDKKGESQGFGKVREGRDLKASLKKMHKTSYLVLTLTMVIVGSILLSPVLSASTNPCSSCHGGYSQYLDILEGNGGNILPTTLTVGQSSTVTVVVENRVNTARYTSLSSVSLTLTSQSGHFTVSAPTDSIGTLAAGTTSATWQITATSAGSDALIITASGRNSHQGLSLSDRYSPSPSINIQAAAPPPPPPPPPPPLTYSVTVQLSANGTTTPSPGIYSYTSGNSAAFTATPNSGYKFSHWLVNGVTNTNNPLTQTITSDTTITPVFTLIPPPPPPTTYTITIQSSPNGTTTPTAGTYNYAAGSSATLNATPNPGYRFDYWRVNGVANTTNPIAIAINSDFAIIPVFSLLSFSAPPPPPSTTFTVDVQQSPNGTTTPNAGRYNYTAGSSATVTASPNEGYRFDFWKINGALNTSNPVTLTIASDLVIDPVFSMLSSPSPLAVIVQPSQNGTTVPASGIYNYSIGAQVTFTAIPNSGHDFNHWLVNGDLNTTNPLATTITTSLEIVPVFTQQVSSPIEPEPLQENQTSTNPLAILAITLLSPAEGEKWLAGTTHDIRWEATGGEHPLSITLEYSTSGNNGTWIIIAENMPNNGSITWLVPQVFTSIHVRATATDNDAKSQSGSAEIEAKIDERKTESASFLTVAVVLHFVAFAAFFLGYYSAKGKLYSLSNRARKLAEKKGAMPN